MSIVHVYLQMPTIHGSLCVFYMTTDCPHKAEWDRYLDLDLSRSSVWIEFSNFIKIVLKKNRRKTQNCFRYSDCRILLSEIFSIKVPRWQSGPSSLRRWSNIRSMLNARV
uniref:Uncharacterized protein n=1 Tax=Cacopsylla melanoneura TaxID=428564 RepID=A0A8D9AMP8_9HEMI